MKKVNNDQHLWRLEVPRRTPTQDICHKKAAAVASENRTFLLVKRSKWQMGLVYVQLVLFVFVKHPY